MYPAQCPFKGAIESSDTSLSGGVKILLTLSPVSFLAYHSLPPAPDPQHGEANRKPFFQLGEGKGENKLENTMSSSLGILSV